MRDRLAALLKRPAAAAVLSVLIGLMVGAIVLAAAGYHPGEAYAALLTGIFSKPKYMVQVLIRSTPLILTGLSVAFAFKTGLFNIGAEGQYIIGSITAAMVGHFIALPPVLHFLFVIACAMLASGLWGGFIGWLKAKLGIHEVITSIMLNWIALYLNNYIITLPAVKKAGSEASKEVLTSSYNMVLGMWKTTPEGRAYLTERPFLLETVLKTDLNYGILIALLAVFIIWFVLRRTTKGYELRAVGLGRDAAEFAGIDVRRSLITSMAIAGALAGLAGAMQITGTMPHRITILAAHEGYGFDGISVALIAGANPIGCIFSGLLFGALKYGSSSIQSKVGAPSEIINITIGAIVFFIAMSSVFSMISERLGKRGGRHGG